MHRIRYYSTKLCSSSDCGTLVLSSQLDYWRIVAKRVAQVIIGATICTDSLQNSNGSKT